MVTSKITTPKGYMPSVAVYARHKLGKTLLTLTAAQHGKILILDAQHGTDWMDHPKLRPHVWHIESYSDWEDAYQFLRHEKHSYEWVSNDTITKLHNYALRKVVGAEGDKPLPSGISLPKRGIAGEHVKLMIDKFRRLPMGVLFVANERVIETKPGDFGDKALLDAEELGEQEPVDENEVEVKWVPDLPEDTRKYLVAETDIIGRLYSLPARDGKRGERRLRLAPHDNYETGYRSFYALPETMTKPNIKRLVQLAQRTGE